MNKHRLFFITTIATLMSAAVVSYAQEIDSTYANGYYVARMEYFRQLPVVKKGVIFLGNSITEAGDWTDVLPGRKVQNRGISGDNSFGVVARLEETLQTKPTHLFVMIGVNDLKRGVPTDVIIRNYERIARHVRTKSPRTRLYLQSVLPVNTELLIEPFRNVKNEDVKILNEGLKKVALDYGAEYVDLWPALADENGELRKEFTGDGIHVKPIAYVHWARVLQKKKLLK
jgi:lysophospholipase L1-like esterase